MSLKTRRRASEMLGFIGLFVALLIASVIGCRAPKITFALALFVGFVEVALR